MEAVRYRIDEWAAVSQTPAFSVYHLKTNRIDFKGNGYATTYYNPALHGRHGYFCPHSGSFFKNPPQCAATLRR